MKNRVVWPGPYLGWIPHPGVVLEKILWEVSGLQLPSKECELKFCKPKLSLNRFANYIRRTGSNFRGPGSN